VKEGLFSEWNGHRPEKLAPVFFSCTVRPTISTTSARASSSWMKAVIFHHRKADHKRHFLVSVAMPYIYILCLCVGLLLVTLVSGALQLVGRESVDLLGRSWSLSGVSGLLLYLLGLSGEIFMLTSLYLVMPAGRMSLRHALLGGVTAALLWELTRRVLIWYFSTLSQVNVVYGSLTTAIVVLLSLEIAATLVLLGAQVISNYERLDRTGSAKPPASELSGAPIESLRPGESPRR
jgi:membrane protein